MQAKDHMSAAAADHAVEGEPRTTLRPTWVVFRRCGAVADLFSFFPSNVYMATCAREEHVRI